MAFISQKSDLEYLPELFEPVPAAERLVVNGIYYNKPSPDTVKVASFKEAGTVEGTTYYKKNDSAWPGRVSEAAKKLLTQTGEQTPVYRPMAGQIYHFSGLDVEITWSHEQITMAEYDFDVRTANACYMLRAEGKSVLNMGSASKVVQDHMVETYTDTYWKDLTVLFTPHYGRRLFECYKDVFRAELICFENNTPEIIVDEALKVVQYYENLPESRCYWYKDGNFRYDFASGEITVTPNQNESR